MAKGLPKWAIKEAKARGAKNIFAYAWSLVKRKGSRKSNPSGKKTKRRGGGKMARKKKRRSPGFTIPLAPVIGIGAGLVTNDFHGTSPLNEALSGDWHGCFRALAANYLGYNLDNGTWDITKAYGLPPLILGVLIHKFVGGRPLNLNRYLRRIPLIRI